jgi:hypothetical protein
MLDPSLSRQNVLRGNVLLSCAGLMGPPARGRTPTRRCLRNSCSAREANFLPTDKLVLEQNILVVNLNGNVVLFDNRMCGDRSNGPTPGKLALALAQAEINPAGVDAIVMTRAHIDHCGRCHPDGTLSSLNTQYFISWADFDVQTDKITSAARSPDLTARSLPTGPRRDEGVIRTTSERGIPAWIGNGLSHNDVPNAFSDRRRRTLDDLARM